MPLQARRRPTLPKASILRCLFWWSDSLQGAASLGSCRVSPSPANAQICSSRRLRAKCQVLWASRRWTWPEVARHGVLPLQLPQLGSGGCPGLGKLHFLLWPQGAASRRCVSVIRRVTDCCVTLTLSSSESIKFYLSLLWGLVPHQCVAAITHQLSPMSFLLCRRCDAPSSEVIAV